MKAVTVCTETKVFLFYSTKYREKIKDKEKWVVWSSRDYGIHDDSITFRGKGWLLWDFSVGKVSTIEFIIILCTFSIFSKCMLLLCLVYDHVRILNLSTWLHLYFHICVVTLWDGQLRASYITKNMCSCFPKICFVIG